jgi:murein DD-endopeptidase MepM/ murein hydrolase activator NlpD
MDLKSTIKRILDEQLDILTNPGVVDPELRITPTKKKSDNTTSDSKNTEKIDVGYVDIPQILIDAYGIELVKSAYESQGFEVTDDNRVTGWALPLPKKYIKSPGPTLKFGAPRKRKNGEQIGHEGVDYPCKDGTPVYATKGGKVRRSYSTDSYGAPNEIIIDSKPYWILYSHLTERYVKDGDVVSIGQQIGTTGKGHLHIEVNRGGPIDNWSQIYSQLV